MPIVDFNTSEPWDSHRIWRWQITRRIRQKIAESGTRASDSQESVLADWNGVPAIHVGFHRYMVMRDNRVHRATKLPKSLNITAGDRVLLMGDVYGWTAEALAEAVPGATFVSVDATPLTQARASQTETAYLQSQIADAGVTGAMAAMVLAEIDDGLPRARRTVVDEDAANRGSRNRIRNELGGAPTHSLTMGMFNFLFDSEAVDISARLHDMGDAPVFHIVNPFNKPGHGKPEPEPALNWKHIAGDQPRDTMVADKDSNTRPLDAEPGIEARSWKALLPDDWIVPHTSYSAHF